MGVDRGQLTATVVIMAALATLSLGSVIGPPALGVAGLAAICLVVLALVHRSLFRWDVLVNALILVILFIPIRRFVLPGNLPFQLEPYRLGVAFLGAAWTTSLLIDPRVRLHRTGLEAPLCLFLAAAVASVLFNVQHIANGALYASPTRIITPGSLDSNVLKTFTFFLSFVLVFYVIVSVIRKPEQVDWLVKLLVCSGMIIAILSVVESRTGVNAFDRLPRVLPFLKENFVPDVPNRGARLRARGPAEHAIALSAALAMLVPLGFYLAVTTRRLRWWVATAVLGVGALAAVSRTGVIMLAVAVAVLLLVRPREMKRLWPAVIPALVVVHFAIPGTLGTLKQSFAPPGGLVGEQNVRSLDGRPGGGRLADIAPSLAEWWERPLVGEGFGTRVTAYDPGSGQVPNAIILDNQWLGTLLETGLAGAAALGWLLLRFLRAMLREARRDISARGWLLGSIAASVSSLAIGMFVFDALSFVQVAFLLFILLGVGISTLQSHAQKPRLVGV